MPSWHGRHICTDREHRPVSRYPAVDRFRAAAALAIVAFHTSQACGLSFAGDLLSSMFALLKVGVTVFFVISGFVLYLPWARAIRHRRPLPDWRQYARRRALRILPAYYLALVLCTAAGLGASTRAVDWWRYLTLTETYRASTLSGGLGVAWSLCVEVAFYIVLPFLGHGIDRLVARRRHGTSSGLQLLVLASLAGGSLLLRSGLAGNPLLSVPSRHVVAATSLPYLFDWFAIGMALAMVAAESEAGSSRFGLVRALSARRWLCWSIAGAIYVLVARQHLGDVFLPQYGLSTHLALGVASGLFVLPALGGDGASRIPGAAGRLAGETFAWLGAVSYGVYLWHMSILRVLMRLSYGGSPPDDLHRASAITYLALVLGVAGIAVAIGAASWYLVERPLQRRRAKQPRSRRLELVVEASG